MVAGRCKSAWSFCTFSTAVPRETPGTRLKEMVTDGNWPTWEMLIGPRLRVSLATALKGTRFGMPLVSVNELLM